MEAEGPGQLRVIDRARPQRSEDERRRPEEGAVRFLSEDLSGGPWRRQGVGARPRFVYDGRDASPALRKKVKVSGIRSKVAAGFGKASRLRALLRSTDRRNVSTVTKNGRSWRMTISIAGSAASRFPMR